jgi:hypothetical protein
MEDFIINGVVRPTLLADGTVLHMLDLRKLVSTLGTVIDANQFVQPSGTDATAAEEREGQLVAVKSAAQCGFIGDHPNGGLFCSTLPNDVLRSVVNMVLARVGGREILTMGEGIPAALEQNGAEQASEQQRDYPLLCPSDKPAIFYRPSGRQDAEVSIDGENVPLPLYDPYLLFDATRRIGDVVEAQKLSLSTLGNIRINPGEIDVKATDISLRAQGQVSILSQFIYSPSGERIAVEQAKMEVAGQMEISGDGGVEVRGARLAGSALHIGSARGNVVSDAMTTDMHPIAIDEHTAMQRSTATSAELHGRDELVISAPRGDIEQRGTDMYAGERGMKFIANRHTIEPVMEETIVQQARGNTLTRVHGAVTKQAKISTTGEVQFQGKDTKIIAADVQAKKVTHGVDGDLKLLPGNDAQMVHSETVRRGRFFSGRTSSEYTEESSTPVPTRITAEEIELLGIGTAEFESVIIRQADAHMSKPIMRVEGKQLSETTAHSGTRVRRVISRRGWFAPRLRGDPAADALHHLMHTAVAGDILPNVLNAVGAGVQTASHLATLAHLSALKHPMVSLAEVLLTRFATGALYSNITQKVTRDERVPVQSHIELGIFTVSNDRTHLEGIWNVDRASIETGEFTTAASQHSVEQRVDTKGWSISFSPAAILGALVANATMIPTALSILPSPSVQKSTQATQSAHSAPMVLHANELFLRCNDAVFSGSNIRAAVVHAIVGGNLTVESLTDLFDSAGKQGNIGASLSALAGLVSEVKLERAVMDHGLGAIPNIRIANQGAVEKKLDEIAQFIGTEKFYLKVGELLYSKGAEIGLRPDGLVTKSDDERIDAGRILREQAQEVHRRRERVINPAIGEFVAMMSQVDAFKHMRARIKEDAIAKNLPPQEVNKLDREVKEFLDQPEVKQSFEKLAELDGKLDDCIAELDEIAEQHPEIVASLAAKLPPPNEAPEEISKHPEIVASLAAKLPPPNEAPEEISKQPEIVASLAAKLPPPNEAPEEISKHPEIVAGMATQSPNPAKTSGETVGQPETFLDRLSFAWKNAQREMKSLEELPSVDIDGALIHTGEMAKQATKEAIHSVMSSLTVVRKKYEEFTRDHPFVAEILSKTVEFAGDVALAGGAVASAATGGPGGLAAYFASVGALHIAVEGGTEGLSEVAGACAKTEQEREEFAKTVPFAVSVGLLSAAHKPGKKPQIKKAEKIQSKSVTKKHLTSAELEKAAQHLDKGPYNSRTAESMLKINHPEAEITSTTLPKATDKNVKLAEIKHGETGIVFDNRGFPIFDKHIKYETRISGDLKNMSSGMHKRMATRQLRSDIETGIINRNMFTEKQLAQIKDGFESIEDYTWHHHQEVGRMQLIQRQIHKDAGHVGGDKLWGMQK